jgi:hypothetical protein
VRRASPENRREQPLYSTDFQRWTVETARLLREGRWRDVDLPHLIEEVEALGRSDRRAISSQLSRLLLHLLKWVHQPERRSDSWLDSITDARTQIALTVEDSPSLADYPAQQIGASYQRARRAAARQTGLPLDTFPPRCPWPVEQVLEEGWLPSPP